MAGDTGLIQKYLRLELTSDKNKEIQAGKIRNKNSIP